MHYSLETIDDMEELWTAVDSYLGERLLTPDPMLDAALADSAAAGLPAISVTPTQGKMLYLFARMLGARRILEIGTLGAYSTIWLARGMVEGGRLVTMEIDPKHADVARRNLERARLTDCVEIRLGPAAESLEQMIADRVAPFDLTFIDADKASIDRYFTSSLQLSRPGALIVIDNVVLNGAVIEEPAKDANIAGVQRLAELLRSERRVEATAIQTVGGKGYDGFALARVNERG
jgi:predicted O-methyltransferase YrrM